MRIRKLHRGACALLLGLLAVGGCYGDFENFVGPAARRECKRLERCEARNYAQYVETCTGLSCKRDARRRCRDDIEDRWRSLDRNDRCTYDPDEAALCMEALRKERKECGGPGDLEAPEDCSFVFDCKN